MYAKIYAIETCSILLFLWDSFDVVSHYACYIKDVVI